MTRTIESIVTDIEANEKGEMLLLESNINDDGACLISEALKGNTSLTLLDLSFNKISDAGAKCLAEALKVNNTLRILNLRNNIIGDKGAFDLAEMIRKSVSLKRLFLRDNDIGPTGLQCIKEALESNEHWTTDPREWVSILPVNTDG